MAAVRYSWQKLDSGKWGVKAQGDLGKATGHAGETVHVARRDGGEKIVVLGPMVMQWNGGRAALYEVKATERNGNGKATNAGRMSRYQNDWAPPAPPVERTMTITATEAKALMSAVSCLIGETDGTDLDHELHAKLKAFVEPNADYSPYGGNDR